tara:strand:+ start:108 stop:593 length:486 start_codon:yes stop_codon:yes gene_type:complete
MKIDINANSLRRLVRLLRHLADELEEICDVNKAKKNKTFTERLTVVPDEESDAKEVVAYYLKIHPTRTRYANNLKSKHSDYKLIKKRLKQGYKVEELKAAILSNSREEFWVRQGLHGIDHIMKKDSNLEKFIENSKGKKNAASGYSPGSQDFSGDSKDFGH